MNNNQFGFITTKIIEDNPSFYQLYIERRIEERPIDEAIACNCNKFRRKGCFYTAKGNYVNNLRINNTVIMPEYTLSTKRETNYYNQSNKDIYQSMGFNVRTVNCDALAQFGGSLHCLSFTY